MRTIQQWAVGARKSQKNMCLLGYTSHARAPARTCVKIHFVAPTNSVRSLSVRATTVTERFVAPRPQSYGRPSSGRPGDRRG